MMNATGWGKTADSAPNGTTAVLRTVTVPIISNQDCLASYGASLIIMEPCALVPVRAKEPAM